MADFSRILFGDVRKESVRSILVAVGVGVVVFWANYALNEVDISTPLQSYAFFVGVVCFAAVSAFRNDGILVSLLMAWVVTGAAVGSGSFAGFHGDPTFWERYVVGPAVLGLGFGAPLGSLGYVLGVTSRFLTTKASARRSAR